jgi:hypothetical protein
MGPVHLLLEAHLSAGPIRSLSQTLSTAAAICAALRANRLSSRWPHHSRTTLLQPI